MVDVYSEIKGLDCTVWLEPEDGKKQIILKECKVQSKSPLTWTQAHSDETRLSGEAEEIWTWNLDLGGELLG